MGLSNGIIVLSAKSVKEDCVSGSYAIALGLLINLCKNKCKIIIWWNDWK